jgi:hypothetical protein
VPNDFDGIAHPQGSGYDVGAYEYVPPDGSIKATTLKTSNFALSVISTGSSLRLTYAVPAASEVHLSLGTIRGEKIGDLVDSRKEPGSYSVTIGAGTPAPGLYLCTLREGSLVCARKLSIVK